MQNLTHNQTDNRWILIAKITRPHGFPREGFFRYRATFNLRGSQILNKVSLVGLSPQGFNPDSPEAEKLLAADSNTFIEVPLAEEASPLGGKWEQAEAALLSFKNSDIPNQVGTHTEKEWVGRYIALRRNEFPQISDSEVYLCDLIGMHVAENPDETPIGQVHSFSQLGKSSEFNLLIQPHEGESFDIPMRCIDWENSHIENSLIVVPSLNEWKNL